MIRGTWVFDKDSGELVPKDEFYARKPAPKRGTVTMPMLIRDCVEVVSMVDGKTYTSKAALRASYKAQGYIEVGDQWDKMPAKPKTDRKKRQKEIRDTLEWASARVNA